MMPSSTSSPLTLMSAPSKETVGVHLCRLVANAAKSAIAARGTFTIALSGGSLPSLLGGLTEFDGLDWPSWRVVLADERCVPESDDESTLKALRTHLFVPDTPAGQATVYGIDEELLGDTAAVAEAYHGIIQTQIEEDEDGMLDMALLGFGPDGHTCSLFPGRSDVLDEDAFPDKFVIPVTDSPKPPSDRVTLTLRTVNTKFRQVLVCGAGDSKAPILESVIRDPVRVSDDRSTWVPKKEGGASDKSNAPLVATANLAPSNLEFPIGMVYPKASPYSSPLTWLVDDKAMAKISVRYTPRLAKVLVGKSKSDLAPLLHGLIMDAWQERTGDSFTVALSGGSLPALLKGLSSSFAERGIDDPLWGQWNVVLADERCVVSSHDDSNLKHIWEQFLSQVPIPESQIVAIDETMLGGDDMDAATEKIAKDYETHLRKVLGQTNNTVDLALLGFGPDGHTCSLFPSHDDMLQERSDVWILPISDSPKPPPHRITMSLGLLNSNSIRRAVFCGAGDSKRPILEQIWGQAFVSESNGITVVIREPAPFPCGLVQKSTFLVDEAAMPEYRYAK